METKQILDLANMDPEQAGKAIADAALLGITPDDYEQSKTAFAPLAQEAKNPRRVDRSVAQAIGPSSVKASLVKEDLGKLDAVSRFTGYFGRSAENVKLNRELNDLALKKMQSDGVLSDDDDIQLTILREKLSDNKKFLDSAGYNFLQGLPTTTGTTIYDMALGVWREKETVAKAGAVGAGAGAAYGAIAGLGVGSGPLALAGSIKGGLTAASVATGAVMLKDGFNQTRAGMYEFLDTATKDDGTPLNLPEGEKRDIANGVGMVAGLVDGASNIFVWGKALSGPLKKIIGIGGKEIAQEIGKQVVGDVGKKSLLDVTKRMGAIASRIGLIEGGTEAYQEIVQIIGEEMGQTFDGSETSFLRALDNIAVKWDANQVNKQTGKTYREENLERVGQALVVGTLTDNTVTIGGKVVSKAFTRKPKPATQTNEQSVALEQPVIENTPLGSGVSGVESMNVYLAIESSNRAIKDAKANQVAPDQLDAIRADIMIQNGVKSVWFQGSKLVEALGKLPSDKAEAVKQILDPSGNFENPLNRPNEYDAVKVARAIEIAPELANLIKENPEAPTVGDYLRTVEENKASRQERSQTREGLRTVLEESGEDIAVEDGVDYTNDTQLTIDDVTDVQSANKYIRQVQSRISNYRPENQSQIEFPRDQMGTEVTKPVTIQNIADSSATLEPQEITDKNGDKYTVSVQGKRVYVKASDGALVADLPLGIENTSNGKMVAVQGLYYRDSGTGDASRFKRRGIMRRVYGVLRKNIENFSPSTNQTTAGKRFTKSIVKDTAVAEGDQYAINTLTANFQDIFYFNRAVNQVVTQLEILRVELNRVQSEPPSPESGVFAGPNSRESRIEFIQATINEKETELAKMRDHLETINPPSDSANGEVSPEMQKMLDNLEDAINRRTEIIFNEETQSIAQLQQQFEQEVQSYQGPESVEVVVTPEQFIQDEQTYRDRIAAGRANPDLPIIDSVVNRPEPLLVDWSTLSEDQRSIIRNHPFIENRNIRFTNTGVSIDEAASEFGARDGNHLLQVLKDVEDSRTLDIIEQDLNIQTETLSNLDMDSPTPNFINTLLQIGNKYINQSVTALNKYYESTRNSIRAIPENMFSAANAKADIDVSSTPIGKLQSLLSQARQGQAATNNLYKQAIKSGDLRSVSTRGEVLAVNTMTVAKTMQAIVMTNRYTKNISKYINSQVAEKISKAGKEFADAYKELGDLVGMSQTPITQKSVVALKNLDKYLKSEGQTGLGIPDSVYTLLANKQSISDLTVDELKYVSDTFDMLKHFAENKDKFYSEVMARNQRNTMDVVRAAVVRQTTQDPRYNPKNAIVKQGDDSVSTLFKKYSNWLESGIDNLLYKLQTLDGPERNFFQNAIYHALNGTGVWDDTGVGMSEKFKLKDFVRQRKITALKNAARLDKRFKDPNNTLVVVPEFQGVESLNDGNLTFQHLLNIAAYYGSAEGRNRLENFGIGIDKIKRVLDRELGVNGWQYIQDSVWDTYQAWETRGQTLELETTGVKSGIVEGESFTSGSRTFRGGYVPLKYEDDLMDTSISKLESALAPYIGDNVKGVTDRGHFESRVEDFKGVLDISHNVIDRGFEEYIHDLAMRVPLINAIKILKDPEINKHMASVIGVDKTRAILENIISLTRSEDIKTMQAMAMSEKSVRNLTTVLRSNVAASAVAFNLRSIYMQLASAPVVWSKMGFFSGAKYFTSSLSEIVFTPHKINEFIAFAEELNPDIKNYSRNVSDSILGGTADLVPDKMIFGTSKLARLSGFNMVRKGLNSAVNKIGFNMLLGSADVTMKALTSVAIYHQFLDGKVKGYPLDVLAKMTEQEKYLAGKAHVAKVQNSTLTISNDLHRAKVQKFAPVLTMFWNDLRQQLNHYILKHREIGYYNRLAVKSFKDKDYSKGFDYFNDGANAYINLIVMGAMIAAIEDFATGEDNEGEELKPLMEGGIEQLFDTLFTKMLVPYDIFKTMYGKGMLGSTPIVRQVYDAYTGFVDNQKFKQKVSTPLAQAGTETALFLAGLTEVYLEGGDLTRREWEAGLRTFSYLQKFPANGAIKIMRAIDDNQVQAPDYVSTLVSGLNQYLQAEQEKPKELQEPEVMKEVEETITILGPKSKEPSFADTAQEVLTNAPMEIDPSFYQTTIRYIESQMDDDNYPKERDSKGNLVPERNSKGQIIRDIEGNPVYKAQDGTTAYGRYQFTKTTWSNIVNQVGPQLGLTNSEADRKNPEKQELAMNYLVRRNIVDLTRQGVEITKETVYSAHYQGIAMTTLAYASKQKDYTLLRKAMENEGLNYEIIITANPWLRKVQTLGAYKRWVARKIKTGEQQYEKWLLNNLD